MVTASRCCAFSMPVVGCPKSNFGRHVSNKDDSNVSLRSLRLEIMYFMGVHFNIDNLFYYFKHQIAHFQLQNKSTSVTRIYKPEDNKTLTRN
jgi:hypothetical protein